MLIPFIIEPSYAKYPVWSPSIRAGIESELARKKYSSSYIAPDELESTERSIFSAGLAVVIGTTPNFINNMLARLSKMGLEALLVCSQPPENAKVRGVVRTDYVSGMYSLLGLLRKCGCERIALYGCFPDSSTDNIKRRAYLEYTASEGLDPIILDNCSGLCDCFSKLSTRLSRVDSLVCVNDIAAVSALGRLKRLGVDIPNEMQLVSFGGSELARLCSPSLTLLDMANLELGRQAVNAFAYLMKNPGEVKLTVRVTGDIIPGGSTKPCTPPIPQSPIIKTSSSSFYDDEEVKRIGLLELLLTLCEPIDRKMLGLLLRGNSTERTAEELSIAPETVRYRMRRLLQNVGIDSRTELLDFVRGSGFSEVFTEGVR